MRGLQAFVFLHITKWLFVWNIEGKPRHTEVLLPTEGLPANADPHMADLSV
jgi:hypothetical protein